MKRYDSICNICGGHDFRPFAQRSDQVPVIMCQTCGHGIVEHFTEDVQALYGDDYFAAKNGSSVGYEDYAYTAEYGLAWAAALVLLLRTSGSVIDIGCANGRLLAMLGEGYDRFGIELNAKMADEATSAGFSIIARDLLDRGSLKPYAKRFDLALAIAVLEHVHDFKGACEAALDLLRTDGLLLFEVPLIRTKEDVWFRSSLEHLHYPTERSLQYLFENVLGLQLTGSVVEVENYGCVYVGLTSKSLDAVREAGTRFEYLRTSPPASLSRKEMRFRWLFDLIHAAKTTPEVLRISAVDPEGLNPLILRRIFDLWASREQRFESRARCLREVENARDWHAAEWKKRDEIITSQQRQIAEMNSMIVGQENDLLGLRAELNRKVERINELEADLNQREESVRKLGAELNREERRVFDLEAQLNSKEERIRDLENSWSWKITRALRLIVNVFRRPRGP